MTFRIPREFTLQPDQSVDSAVEHWKDGERTIISDVGFYNQPFRNGPHMTVTECQTEGDGKPQIVVFADRGVVGAGLYYVIPGGRTIQITPTRTETTSLWIRAESPNPADLSMLLAIMKSFQVKPGK
jgi:hypothetical protein